MPRDAPVLSEGSGWSEDSEGEGDLLGGAGRADDGRSELTPCSEAAELEELLVQWAGSRWRRKWAAMVPLAPRAGEELVERLFAALQGSDLVALSTRHGNHLFPHDQEITFD